MRLDNFSLVVLKQNRKKWNRTEQNSIGNNNNNDSKINNKAIISDDYKMFNVCVCVCHAALYEYEWVSVWNWRVYRQEWRKYTHTQGEREATKNRKALIKTKNKQQQNPPTHT